MRFTTLFIDLTSATLAVSAPLKVRSIDRFDLYPRALQVRDIDGDDVVVYRFRRGTPENPRFLEPPPTPHRPPSPNTPNTPHSSVASQLQPPSPGASSNPSKSSVISAARALMRVGGIGPSGDVGKVDDTLAKYDPDAPKAGPSSPKIQRSPKPSDKTPFVYSPHGTHPFSTEKPFRRVQTKGPPIHHQPQPQQPRPPSPSPPQRGRRGGFFSGLKATFNRLRKPRTRSG